VKISDESNNYPLQASSMKSGKVYKERGGKVYMKIDGVVDESGEEISATVEGIDLNTGAYTLFQNHHRFKECPNAVLVI
jgi:hypothetical protein